MRYLFVYKYKGKNHRRPENGEGSMEMTLHGTDQITPKVIQNACEIAIKTLNNEGVQVDVLVPTGWFKYDGEDCEGE